MATQDIIMAEAFRARQHLRTAGHIVSITVFQPANFSPMSSEDVDPLQAVVGAKPLMQEEDPTIHMDRVLHLANSVTVSSYKWVKNINFVLYNARQNLTDISFIYAVS